MKISLHMNGRTMSFSKEELISKLERLEKLENQFPIEETEADETYEEANKPTEGKYFKVNPVTINKNIFKEKKIDFMQEWVRESVLRALDEVNKRPRRYAKPFTTYMPRRTWRYKTVRELKEIARNKGGHVANWVEQSLEWGQRITNGEPWIDICNTPDTANWYRLVIWKDDNAKIVGGSSKCGDSLPASTVFGNHSDANDILHFTVPLIVFYL